MKHLKLFEDINIKQQPFWLSGDKLYVSDYFAKYIAKDVPEYNKKSNDDFFNNVKTSYTSPNFFGSGKSHTWESYVEKFARTNVIVRWRDIYAMNIIIKGRIDRKNDSGQFHHYIGGSSGDSSMHGKNMIRATRTCNINLIIKYFPIFNYIKNAHKKLQSDKFFDVIKNAIIENPKLKKYITEGDYPKDYDDFLIHLKTDLYNL